MLDTPVRKRAGKKAAVQTAAPLVPANPTYENLRKTALGCTACPLWKGATQTVFGEGPLKAKIILVGEQPGDEEDIAGHPFVGPAGKLLDLALEEVGIKRSECYVTNAVKHFKWEPAGKRRIHKTPNAKEIAVCRPWLDAEIALLKPKVVVCLGATAAQALLGRNFRVTERHGELIETNSGFHVMATVHPSAILRTPDEETRHRERERFTEDLRKLKKLI